MSTPEFASVTDLGRGVAAISSSGSGPGIPAEEVARSRRLIEAGRAEAVVHTPGVAGRQVLMAPTTTVLVRLDTISHLSGEVLSDVGGEARFQDRTTALLDIQWRLWLLGQRVVTAEGPLPADWKVATANGQLERTRGLLTMLEGNLTQPLRGRILTLAELAATSSALTNSGTDTTALDLQRSPGADDVRTLTVPAAGLIGAFAVDRAIDSLRPSQASRERIDQGRRVPDRAIASLIRESLPMILEQMGATSDVIGPLITLLNVNEELAHRVRVLIVAPDEGDAAVRAATLAERLGTRTHVRTTSTKTEITTDAGASSPGWIHDHVQWADVLVLVSSTLDDVPGARFSSVPLVADFATRDVAGWLMNGPRTRYRSMALQELMARADLVVASDEIQRSILLGALAAAERVNADVYDDDPSLNSLVMTDSNLEAEIQFCLHPVRSADFTHLDATPAPPRPNDLKLIGIYFEEGGISNVARRAAGRIRRKLPIITARKES